MDAASTPTPHQRAALHLLSGGMDSVTMLYDLKSQGHTVHALLFDYGQRHAKELAWADYHCDRCDVLRTRMTIDLLRGSELTDGQGGIVVPNRNAILLSIAVNLAVAIKADTITFACNKDDEEVFPDCRQAFVDAMNSCVKAAGYEVEIWTPYIDKQKWQIASRSRELGVELNKTWSCYRNGAVPCGVCPACVKHAAAVARILA